MTIAAVIDINSLFIRAARALYGDNWQSATARDLEMADRQVRRIASGQVDARPGMLIDLWRLILERQAEMDEIIEEIKRHAALQDLAGRPNA